MNTIMAVLVLVVTHYGYGNGPAMSTEIMTMEECNHVVGNLNVINDLSPNMIGKTHGICLPMNSKAEGRS